MACPRGAWYMLCLHSHWQQQQAAPPQQLAVIAQLHAWRAHGVHGICCACTTTVSNSWPQQPQQLAAIAWLHAWHARGVHGICCACTTNGSNSRPEQPREILTSTLLERKDLEAALHGSHRASPGSVALWMVG
eukprot:365443-Chlamydomonas_euryale.AAC.16